MDTGIGNLIKHQLENLLEVIAFENNSGVVEVDGFSFRPGGLAAVAATGNHAWESLDSYLDMEPRLPIDRRFLNRVLGFVQLQHKGQPMAITGFRLKNLARWANYKFPSLFANLNFECMTSACSCRCEFCFLDGMGPHRMVRRHMSMQEARTRARYFSAEKKTGLLFPAAIPGEPTLHPHFLDFLRMARESNPEECFYITTNGDFLTRELIDELVQLKPISINVSLNSADLQTRARVMRSKRAQTAIESISLLKEHRVSFIGSIVAAPCFTLEDIENTARYFDEHDALMIRLLLAGYTKYQSVTPFDREQWWGEIVRLAHKLRAELPTPILVQPNFYRDQDIAPRIDGIYRNSPAEHAGLREGDLVLEIDGRPVFAKAEIQDELQIESSGPRTIKISRDGKEFTAEVANELPAGEDFYPYKPRGYRTGMGVPDGHCLGIHVAQGFRLEYLRFLKQCVENHPGARKVLIFTTPLVRNHLAQAMGLVKDLPECRLDNVEARITTAPQNYWGGNIIVGDLNVAQDYINHLKTLQEYGYVPDLAVIPRSFVNIWGFDVSGKSYTEIERHTGIPVELLAVERIMW